MKKEIKLLNLLIENLKGIILFEYNFNGKDAVIRGENATGKTSIKDGWRWLLFGCDSTGRIATGKGAFGITPKDSTGKTLKGLVTCVIGKIQFGDKTHELRKELHERLGKGKQVKGYEVKCMIDEVTKTITEYKEWIAKHLDEDTFKLLTDTQFFNDDDKFPWKKRRDVLLEIAGEDIGTPDGFEELLAELNDRSMDDFTKVLKTRKKTLVDKQKEINPRIDELQRQVKAYAGGDTTELEYQRDDLDKAIAELDILREGVLSSQNERVVALEAITDMKADRSAREITLSTDTSGIKKYVDEKAGIVNGIESKKQDVELKELVIKGKQSELEGIKQVLTAHNFNLGDIRESYKTLFSADLSDETCFNCGKPLDGDKLADSETKRTLRLNEISKQGDLIKTDRNACRDKHEKVVEAIKLIELDLENLNIELKEITEYSNERMPDLDLKISVNVTLDPEGDEEWRDLSAKITALEGELGEAPSDQLAEIKESRCIKAKELAVIEISLNASDQRAKNAERITELETEEKEIGQKVTTLEKQIAEIASYKKAESLIVEAAVNDKFEHVKFRLYKELLKQSDDGEQETEPTCEATLNGVPYGDMSTGQKILVGIDIINVLSKHYDMSVCLFIDNSESLTYPIEANSQVICLQAVDGVKELIVEKKGE